MPEVGRGAENSCSVTIVYRRRCAKVTCRIAWARYLVGWKAIALYITFARERRLQSIFEAGSSCVGGKSVVARVAREGLVVAGGESGGGGACSASISRVNTLTKGLNVRSTKHFLRKAEVIIIACSLATTITCVVALPTVASAAMHRIDPEVTSMVCQGSCSFGGSCRLCMAECPSGTSTFFEDFCNRYVHGEELFEECEVSGFQGPIGPDCTIQDPTDCEVGESQLVCEFYLH